MHVHERKITTAFFHNTHEVLSFFLTWIRTPCEDRVRCARAFCKSQTDTKTLQATELHKLLVFNLRPGRCATDAKLATSCATLAGRELNRNALCAHLSRTVSDLLMVCH